MSRNLATFTLPIASLTGLRIAVAGLLAAHGCIRIAAGTVGDFGSFLADKGFLFGVLVAWAVTLYEIVGGLFFALGRGVRPIAWGFMLHQCLGIALVHAQHGWFVVGYTSGGVEYSVLLLVCLWGIRRHPR